MSEPSMLDPQRWDKWGRWAKELETEILHFHSRYQMWEEIAEAIRAGGHADRAYFLDFFTEIWSAAQATTIRRVVDRGDDVISLHRLLREIRDSAHDVTKERFLIGWDLDRLDETDEHDRTMKRILVENADRCWEEITGDAAETSLHPAKVQSDIDGLETATNIVKRFVDKNLAHRAAGGRATATFADLDTSMSTIVSIFRRYELLVTGSSPVSLTPAIQGDWKGPFRQPLF